MTAARVVALFVALASLVLASPSVVLSQGADTKPPEGGWRSLFNGKDLRGWRQLNGAHLFEAREGAIVGTTVPGEPNGFLVTEEEFGDFILEMDVRIDVLMNNSGIQFRSLSHEAYQNGRVHGYQAEIDTKPQRWSGSIYDEARRGWLYTLEINPEAKDAFVNNRWNTYRIEAIGTTNRIWVNGIPTANLEDAETVRGFIGLQLHANQAHDPDGSRQIRWRNIRIKTDDLQPTPPDDLFVVNLIPNSVSPQEAAQGYTLLWDGKTVEGWKAMDGSLFPVEEWEIQEGALRAVASEEGTGIRSERQFRAFELQFEFKPAEEGVLCGVDYLQTGSELSGEPSTYCQMAAKKTKPGQWNRGLIRLLPTGRVEYWLNGDKILEYVRGSDAASRGPIRIRNHGDAVSYRSIKIRELP